MGSRKRSRPSMLFDIDDDGINNGIGSGMTAGPMRSDYSTAHPLAHNEAAAAVTARRHTPLGYTQHTAHVRPCGYFGVTPSMETAAVAASTSRSVPSLLEDPSRAYVYYSCSNYEQLRIAHPEWNSNTINGELGRMWNALAPEERQAWGTCTAEAKSLVDSSLTSHRTSPSSAQPPPSGAGMQSQTSDSW
ncbi:hypothetical protein GGI15_002462 [Coemansia interrupta]|uniref:HMG box domain-containing protein n=1 Tax=Coemansia interrupta TaxID=1126814 RepID=A0A9W8HCJ7_9FUNG|nr:hypothetical protein GGI15_002462 [Coemansia interrupta]